MRILHIDLDSLRADHLGCYGYLRKTTPTIDAIAEQAIRFENCYISDAPCLPSRTALWSGRFGIHSGVISHGGARAQPYADSASRGFRDIFAQTSWMSALASAGYKTATVSSFAQRHAAWHWYAGYEEIIDPGGRGQERADQVTPLALDWLQRNAREDNWFLHVNFWDAHTPYRTPQSFGNPFQDAPLPAWLNEDMRKTAWDSYGPMSAQELNGYPQNEYAQTAHQRYPRIPQRLDSMAAVRQWIDGYDTGIRFADEHIGQLVDALDDAGVLQETAIVVSADHGENQGELNVWGDHQTADIMTCRVPLIVRWPGLGDQPRVDRALHYQFDWAATLIELVGSQVPDNWDGQPFTAAFLSGEERGRDFLVTSQGAWTCQRGLRFEAGDQSFLFLRTDHDGHKDLKPFLLFNLTQDPHEQYDLSADQPQRTAWAAEQLQAWLDQELADRPDPMQTVLQEGGPFHTRGQLPAYLTHLQATGRAQQAGRLAERHPQEQ